MANQSQSSNQNRGFANMDPERQREIAAAGGRASHGSDSARNVPSQGKSQEQQASTGTRGGTHEQHVNAGRQSHKNS
ncbi:hypothetical protein IGB42_04093 [Andreprevotia sp. IGB-42]|uniref:KGG domain-containing protein n=1 Tax=Andreprevotia sp. IGB-42 TaxID=2497473 RepID=UPI001356A395|nr:KGG domain-containing protein [Andreprevotia sp. IGB-42]KAF0811475.1 hypothetical protein IGB42_04093 [Andreprevotia sp. IGB-42]